MARNTVQTIAFKRDLRPTLETGITDTVRLGLGHDTRIVFGLG